METRACRTSQGAINLLTAELKERIKAEPLIQFLNDLALGKTEGTAISERKEIAGALLDAESKIGELLKGIADPTASRAGRRQLPEGITHKQLPKVPLVELSVVKRFYQRG